MSNIALLIRKLSLSLAVIVAMLSPVLWTTGARAQGGDWQTTLISVTGDDAHTSTGCQINPCLSINAALTQTVTGGQVSCLGPDIYYTGLTATITSSVTIDCPASSLSILICCTVNGIIINAPAAIVTLRNLNLNGMNAPEFSGAVEGVTGIVIQAAAVVNIEDCVIENFSQSGISDQRTSGSGQLFIRDTVMRNNGSSSSPLSGGISIAPASGVTATVSIDHSQISSNYFGVVGDGRSGGTIKSTISDSVISGNTEDGIAAVSSGSSVWFLVDQTKVSGNAFGLAVGGSGTEILARNSSIFDNATGLHTSSGGALYTYGTNSLNGNATNGAFTGTLGLRTAPALDAFRP